MKTELIWNEKPAVHPTKGGFSIFSCWLARHAAQEELMLLGDKDALYTQTRLFFLFFITISCIFLNIVTFFPPFFFEGLGTQVSTEECKRKARCTRQPRLAEGCRRLKDSLLQENTVQPGFVLYRGCVSKRGCC